MCEQIWAHYRCACRNSHKVAYDECAAVSNDPGRVQNLHGELKPFCGNIHNERREVQRPWCCSVQCCRAGIMPLLRTWAALIAGDPKRWPTMQSELAGRAAANAYNAHIICQRDISTILTLRSEALRELGFPRDHLSNVPDRDDPNKRHTLW